MNVDRAAKKHARRERTTARRTKAVHKDDEDYKTMEEFMEANAGFTPLTAKLKQERPSTSMWNPVALTPMASEGCV